MKKFELSFYKFQQVIFKKFTENYFYLCIFIFNNRNEQSKIKSANYEGYFNLKYCTIVLSIIGYLINLSSEEQINKNNLL